MALSEGNVQVQSVEFRILQSKIYRTESNFYNIVLETFFTDTFLMATVSTFKEQIPEGRKNLLLFLTKDSNI